MPLHSPIWGEQVRFLASRINPEEGGHLGEQREDRRDTRSDQLCHAIQQLESGDRLVHARDGVEQDDQPEYVLDQVRVPHRAHQDIADRVETDGIAAGMVTTSRRTRTATRATRNSVRIARSL